MATGKGSLEADRAKYSAAAQEVRPVVDAVCDELGIAARETSRREAVEARVLSAWQRGPRQPLDLVRAGLGG